MSDILTKMDSQLKAVDELLSETSKSLENLNDLIQEDNLILTIVKKKGYLIYGSTGCSCCRIDNFIQGIFHDVDYALDTAASHISRKTVCSQYSDNGNYYVYEIEYEEISDGRIIVDNIVFNDDSFFETGDIANNLSYGNKLIGEFDK